jgi:ribosomal protein L11 methylase PrmA
VCRLQWQPGGTEWHDYDETGSYTAAALADKKRIVAEMLGSISPTPRTVWDLGANTGRFSRLASDRGITTISWDKDPGAVEENYRACVENGETEILPLVLDLTNPSPGIGWENAERESVLDRGPADVGFALALIHHLAIANNVPLPDVVRLMGRVCRWLIIEFVPKGDPQVERLLRTRADIFVNYDREGFERAFAKGFAIRRRETIEDSDRVLYLMETRGARGRPGSADESA